MNIGGIVFPLEQQSRDDESVVYHGQYDTEGVPHTKSGDRQPVQVSMEVRCLRAVPHSDRQKRQHGDGLQLTSAVWGCMLRISRH